MAILTKAQLEALNQSSFPDQSTEAITPAILRTYNTATIDTLVDSLDTGSFTTDAEFNAFTSSTNSSITQLNASSASQQISINALNGATSSYATSAITASSLITASFSGNTLTFTKGDSSTFGVVIPDVSGSAGNFVTTSSFNAYTASTDSSITQLNASSASQQISINALNTNSGSVNSSITQLNASSASQQISINALNAATSSYVTSAITASSLITASFSGNTLTFTKGNGTTFGVVIPDVSGSTIPAGTVSSSAQIVNYGIFATTGSNQFIGNQAIDGALTITGAIIGSQSIFLQPNANDVRTLEIYNTAATDTHITASGGNLFLGNDETYVLVTTYANQKQVTIRGDEKITASGSLDISGSLSASLEQGYVWVGNGNGRTVTVATSSFTSVLSGSVPAGTVSSSAQILAYNIFATTGSNTFEGLQTIKSNNGTPLILDHSDASPTQNTLLAFFKSGSAEWSIGNLGTDDSFILYNPTTFQTPISVAQNNSVTLLGSLTASLQQGYAYVGDGSGKTSAVATSSFAGATINTGSFATTGSNVFIGDQTLSDSSANASTISPWSGSFVLVAKGTTSGSAGLSNITSVTSSVNLIFKNSNALSGSTILSGSNNILQLAPAPTAGFRRQLGSSNIMMTGQVPEITGSATYTVGISSNYANNIMRLRGPVSSSAWSFSSNIVNGNFNVGNADATSANQAIAGGNMSNNILMSSVNYNAYTTPLSASANFNNNLVIAPTNLTAFSSSIQSNNNIFNGNSFTVNNSYFGTASTNAAQRLALSYNVFGGINSSGLTTSGSNTTTSNAREVIGNTTNGSGISLGAVLNGDNSHLYSTLVHGSNLTVTGSSLNNTYAQAGSAFFGRNNSVNGTAARSGETVFAVGTGTSTSTRKTGFLIDSSSNSYFEGNVNISGSLLVNGLSPATIDTGSLATTGSNSFNGNQTITGSLTTSQRIQAQGINLYSGSSQGIYIGDKTNFNPATTGVPSEFSHTVIGQGALNAFLLGDRNTVVGRAALKAMTTGSDNLAFGAFAGEGLISGSSNFFVGTGAGSGVENGSNNFFLGNAAGNQFRSGSGNIIIGPALGTQFVSGSGNLIIGQYGSKVVDNVDRQFSLTYGEPNGGRTNLFYKSGSESDNLYLYGGLEVQTQLRLSRGSDKQSAIVSVGSSGATITNSLATTDSIILVTTQNSNVAGDEYPAVVSSKTNGSFTINHNYGGTLEVGYLIINATP